MALAQHIPLAVKEVPLDHLVSDSCVGCCHCSRFVVVVVVVIVMLKAMSNFSVNLSYWQLCHIILIFQYLGWR